METSKLAAAPKPRSSSLQSRPLSPALGAEIVGVDLSRPMDAATFARVLDAAAKPLLDAWLGGDREAPRRFRALVAIARCCGELRDVLCADDPSRARFAAVYVGNLFSVLGLAVFDRACAGESCC